MAVDQMHDGEPATAPAGVLAEARAKRADLHSVIVALEKAIAAPATGRLRDWSERVHDALVEVGAAFERHIAVVEGPEGLFDEVTQTAPRLANALERLRSEHLEIRTAIVEALDAVRLTAGEARTTDDGRDVVVGILAQLMRHRQHGADVVYDAYAVDIGTGE